MKNIRRSTLFCLITCLCIIFTSSALVCAKHTYQGRIIVGKKERILIFKEKILYKAKLDTGSKISSLLAYNIKEFKSGAKIWVSFQVQHPTTKTFIDQEFPLKRYTYIKQHRSNIMKNIRYVKRPVVMLPVCLDQKLRIIEVNLVDRSHFIYPVLLGRDAIIQFNGVVDPSKVYTSTPNCEAML